MWNAENCEVLHNMVRDGLCDAMMEVMTGVVYFVISESYEC